MEKKQYELCIEILKRLNKAGVLPHIIIIGSWCIYFYKDYFSKIPYIDHLTIKTRDLDFLIDKPGKITCNVDVPNILKDLGFVTIFKGSKGYIKLDHPELILEFLVPERGKGTDKPFPLPALAVNAVTLRFLSFLTDNVIKSKVENFYVNLPHPINFALHKLIIYQRRTKEEKSIKDRDTAIKILKALINKGEAKSIRSVFGKTLPKWQKKILNGLEPTGETDILDVLKK